MKLYHGSSTNIEGQYLIPHLPFKTYDYKPSLYFTDKIEMALLYSINPIRNYIKINNKKGEANAFSSYFKYNDKIKKVILYECYKGMLDEVYNNPAYLYIYNIDDTKANQYIEDTGYRFCEPIKFNEKIFIPNVLEQLKQLKDKNKIDIINFENLTFKDKYYLYDYISARANACESEAEVEFFKEKFADIDEVQKRIYLNGKNQ